MSRDKPREFTPTQTEALMRYRKACDEIVRHYTDGGKYKLTKQTCDEIASHVRVEAARLLVAFDATREEIDSLDVWCDVWWGVAGHALVVPECTTHDMRLAGVLSALGWVVCNTKIKCEAVEGDLDELVKTPE
jgi:hypothetical protein